jgi:hypothetical protein
MTLNNIKENYIFHALYLENGQTLRGISDERLNNAYIHLYAIYFVFKKRIYNRKYFALI